MPKQLSDRSITQSKIKRAATEAQNQTTALDAQAAKDLRDLWGQVLQDIYIVLMQSSAIDGLLRSDRLGRVKATVSYLLDGHGASQLKLLDSFMMASAEYAISPFKGSIQTLHIPLQSVRAVKAFLAADGLQLSDRVWGSVEDAKAIFNKRITNAVVMGQSASEAALEMMKAGNNIPLDLQNKTQSQTVQTVYSDIKNMFFGDEYQKIKLVFTTEINRAHGVAFEAAVQSHPDTIGTKFLLSPHHPKTDICDMHAKVNRYGLGAGVYPIGKNPWPAHPGTISYTQVVFNDEVSDSDRKNKTDRISWLKQLSPQYQAAVLGKNKALALRLGYLKENEINTLWRVLKQRFERRGYDLDLFS